MTLNYMGEGGSQSKSDIVTIHIMGVGGGGAT